MPAYSSIDVLPDFPVLNYYSMPIVLFDEFARYVPDIAPELKSIAECERMGGVVLCDKVPFVLQIANDALKQAVRDPAEPYTYDGLIELQKALAYSAEHELAFTEAFE